MRRRLGDSTPVELDDEPLGLVAVGQVEDRSHEVRPSKWQRTWLDLYPRQFCADDPTGKGTLFMLLDCLGRTTSLLSALNALVSDYAQLSRKP
jgi:hypothetical protein